MQNLLVRERRFRHETTRFDPLWSTEDGGGLMDKDWMGNGACREHGPSRFFPHDGAGVETAKLVCKQCPVRTECLDHALLNRIDHGVWGGCSERERKRILLRRRQSAGLTSIRLSAT